MHWTIEEVQIAATPAVEGPLRVYFVFSALALTTTATRWSTYLVAAAAFSLLSIHAVGRTYLRFFPYPLGFLLPSLAIIALTAPGEPVATYWVVELSDRGVDVAVTTGLRTVASLSVLSFLTLTTTAPELVAALDRLRLPDSVVELLLLVYRGIQVLVEQATRLHTAARLRGGFRSRRSQFRTTKLLGASLLVSAVDRATAAGTAMESRNYAGRMPVSDSENGGYLTVGAVLAVLVAARWVA